MVELILTEKDMSPFKDLCKEVVQEQILSLGLTFEGLKYHTADRHKVIKESLFIDRAHKTVFESLASLNLFI